MNRRERLFSMCFAVFVAFKIAETALHLENWPASNVAMFSGLRPRQFVPLHSRLEATRQSRPVGLTHWDFALSEDELSARLHPDGGVGARCARLVASYNRAVTEPHRRIENATVVVEPVPRPGLWTDVKGWRVPCVPPPQGPAANGVQP